MSKKTQTLLKHMLCYAVIAAMVISFMPVNVSQVSAASFQKDSKVTGLTVTSTGYEYANLKWDAFDGAAGYQIYKSNKKKGTFKLQGSTELTTFKGTGKFIKKSYFKVRAYKVNKSGEKIYSKFSKKKEVLITLGKPSLSITPGQTEIKLSWNAIEDATGYQIKRATKKSGIYRSVKDTTQLSFTNIGASAARIYYYKARAYKTVGNKKHYGPYCAAVTGATLRSAPENLTATAINNEVRLTWSKSTLASGYQVYRSTAKNGSYSSLGSTSDTNFTDKNVSVGTKYFYKVCAYIDLNEVRYNGDCCDPVSRAFHYSAPVVKVTPQEEAVKLSWDEVPGVAGYQVYRADKPNGKYTKLGKTDKLTYKNTDLTLDKVYYYRVRAYQVVDSKNRYGSFSGELHGMTKIKAPSKVEGKSNENSISLTWKKATNATAYEVYRSTEANGEYEKLGTSKDTSYTDKQNLVKKQAYFYKVRGYVKFDGVTYYGEYNSPSASRDAVIKCAKAWDNCKESDGSFKKIIDVYNSDLAPGCGKLSYKVAWCAAFVSAVGIKAKATDIIVRHSYCPTMLNTYKKKDQYTSKKKYSPPPGDVVLFDWNRNNVPDHVGLVYSIDGSTITSIEGNKNDRVDYRKYSKGYTYLLGYGLPAYDDSSGVVFTAGDNTLTTASVIQSSSISTGDPDGYSELGDEYGVAEKKLSVGCGEEATEMEQMKVMLKAVKEEAKTEDIDECSESEYYAAFIYRLCQDADIDVCLVTETNEDGGNIAWVEVTLDGELYKIDPTKEDFQPEKYVPEVTDYNDGSEPVDVSDVEADDEGNGSDDAEAADNSSSDNDNDSDKE